MASLRLKGIVAIASRVRQAVFLSHNSKYTDSVIIVNGL